MLIANGLFQDTAQIRKLLLLDMSRKDTLSLRNNAEKYAFYGDSCQKAWVFTKLATFYLQQNEPQNALKYAKKGIKYQENKKEAANLLYICQVACFLGANYTYSDLYRDSVWVHSADSTLRKQSLFIYMISQIHQYEWEKAQNLAKSYFQDTSLYWDSIFTFYTSRIKFKSVQKAVIFSYLLPGLGQWYAGYKKQGLISFIFTSFVAFMLYFTLKEKWYLLSYFIVFGTLRRFYLGGARFAKKQVESYNLSQKEECVRGLKREIQRKCEMLKIKP
ncbi:MAG: hypothetical protein RML94_09510 [Bacteroidia bacterium]|nr:hypothetical protein [Bacteroidia bacterium]